MAIFLLHLLFVFLLHYAGAGSAAVQEECFPASCGESGMAIRFPFWLKDRQPDYCGYPGFELSCSKSNTTVLELQLPVKSLTKNLTFPVSLKVAVQEIDYKSQVMKTSALNASCLPKELLSVNYSVFPFEISEEAPSVYTLFNCSSSYTGKHSGYGNKVACLSVHGYQVLGFPSFYSISDLPLSSCVKMYDISNFPLEVFNGLREYSSDQVYLRWSGPSCADCEAEGKYCKLKNNDTSQGLQCFDIPKQPGHRKGVSKTILLICAAGLFLVVLIVGVMSGIFSLKRKKEDEKKSEMFLEDYKAFRLTSFSYADIKKITNQFKEKLGEGSYGRVYKGKLPNELIVAVKVLNIFRGHGEESISEVGRIGRIHHVNVVRLVGYCADGNRRALVYEFMPNDSLQRIVSSENQIPSLGWEKWQEIAIGIAKGIDHIHRGSNQEILHLDIKPHNVLLDENYNPKITDIGLAKLSSKELNVVSLIASQEITDYVAPEVFSSNFHNASHKSDVYSFGMLLFDMVGRRKGYRAGAEESSQIYFPEWVYYQLDVGEDVAIQIDREENSYVYKKLIIVGLWCTQWYLENRPSMKVVIQMLEGENVPIMPPNPFASRREKQPNATEHGSRFDRKHGSISRTS